MNLLYNTGIRAYAGLARAAALSSVKVKKMLDGQAATLDRLATYRSNFAPDGFDLWIHAASLGEFEQGRPLIDSLLDRRPETKILLSFFSPSGYEVRVDKDPRIAIVYLPFDLPSNASAFIEAVKPKKVIFVKYEFWGNYLSELKRRAIPTYGISVIFRPNQIFFKPWGGVFRRMLRCFTHLYVQDERSKQLLKGIGIENVTVAGDTRFDRVTAIRRQGRSVPEVELFLASAPGRFTLVVGSSWERDENVYIPYLHKHPELRAIIAPHEFSPDRLAELSKRLGEENTILFTKLVDLYKQNPDLARDAVSSKRYLIIDCFGLLSSLYRYADVAYIGGGFGAGIHNINEAAVYSVPVVFGPRHAKFIEASELIACGGGFCVEGKENFASMMDAFLQDGASLDRAGALAGEYIVSKIGATPRIMEEIFQLSPLI